MSIDEAKLKFPVGTNVEWSNDSRYGGRVVDYSWCEVNNEALVLVEGCPGFSIVVGFYASGIK